MNDRAGVGNRFDREHFGSKSQGALLWGDLPSLEPSQTWKKRIERRLPHREIVAFFVLYSLRFAVMRAAVPIVACAPYR
jgi:hypothetical protein